MQIESGARLALLHGGNIRSMCKYSKGHVFTVMDLNKMTAIMDHYEYVLITGEILVQILENSYRALPMPLGCFLHLAGVNAVVDPSSDYDEEEIMESNKELFKGRVKKVFFDNFEFDRNEQFTAIGQHFILEGKDGLVGFKRSKHLGMEDKIMTHNQEILTFARVANVKKYQDEYYLFKKFIAEYISDSDIRVVQNKNHYFIIDKNTCKLRLDTSLKNADNAKIEILTQDLINKYGLSNSFSKSKFCEMLDSLKISCLKRLRKYRIVEGIRKLENKSVFELNPKFYSKVEII